MYLKNSKITSFRDTIHTNDEQCFVFLKKGEGGKSKRVVRQSEKLKVTDSVKEERENTIYSHKCFGIHKMQMMTFQCTLFESYIIKVTMDIVI